MINGDGKHAVSASSNCELKVWILEQFTSNFIRDNSFQACDISPDGESIVAVDFSVKFIFCICRNNAKMISLKN